MQNSSNYSKFARFLDRFMRLIKTKKELKSLLDEIRSKNRTIGLVPTMGALHQGHLSLVERAVTENDQVIVSIFVNPTQFNHTKDLEAYPKKLKEDLLLLSPFTKQVTVFAPAVAEIYTREVVAQPYQFGGLDRVMEGAFREGHFEGVATIVETLLNLVLPNRAYFGEKDFQQLLIIRRLVQSKAIPVSIVGCPIVREPSGLAMSSRNSRLSKRLREEASLIYKTLNAAKTKFGTKSAKQVTEWAIKEFDQHRDLELEYFQIAQAETLTPVHRKRKSKKYRAFIAVYAGGVRLIDNIALN